jgi:predicted RNA binding protein YcfA (HicA-like mRNA interferase family)
VNKRKLLAKARRSPNNLRFADFLTLMVAFGFQLDRIEGDHHIFRHPTIAVRMNVQPDDGQAKAYQVSQLLKIVARHGLELEE